MSALSLRDVRLLQLRADLFKHIEDEIPGFCIKRKDRSWLMAILSKILFFNKGFMRKYVTTIYPAVYVPKFWGKHRKLQLTEMEILAHEFVHLRDRKKLKWLFSIGYLTPQIFSLLAFGALWNPWYLLSLLFLLPWPSPLRAWAEFRAYRMSIAFYYWAENKNCDIDWVTRQFTSSNYYYMFPFENYIKKKLSLEFKKIVKDDIPNDMLKIKNIIKKRL